MKVDTLKEHFRLFTSGAKSLSHVFYGNDMDFGLIQDFVACVEENRVPSITGYDGLKALEVAMAAYQSINAKTTVNL